MLHMCTFKRELEVVVYYATCLLRRDVYCSLCDFHSALKPFACKVFAQYAAVNSLYVNIVQRTTHFFE